MKTLAETMQMMGGVFLLVQILILLLILVLAVVKSIQYYARNTIHPVSFPRSHHAILFLGIFGFAWGMFTQMLGFVQALNAIIEAADVSPQLILMGLKTSFINPLIGFVTGLAAALVWGILHGRYTAFLNRAA
jgi:hypothetical protein